jgi:hypothetical protein
LSVTIEPTLARYARPLVDSRPPTVRWDRPPPPPRPAAQQPPLDLTEPAPDMALGPAATPARRHVVSSRWAVRPRPDLPEATEWSAALAMSVMQALLLQRAVTPLSRWLAEDVLVAIGMHQRRRRSAPPRSAVPITVHSIRVQHPAPDVAEVAAHLIVGRRLTAMAFRLEAMGSRWLCTALELGPRSAGD